MYRRRVKYVMSAGMAGCLAMSLAVGADLTSRPTSAQALMVRRVQLVTVTDTSAVLTWETSEPADAQVHYGVSRYGLDRIAKPTRPIGSDAPGRFHYCQLHGLTPGTRYYYRVQADHARALGNLLGPSEFTTLTLPPGRELFSFATMTDTHIGQESVARLVVRNKVLHHGVRWHDPNLPFWRLAVGAAIDEINAGPAAFTIVKGDITDDGTRESFAVARKLFAPLEQSYYAVRGNHDGLGTFLKAFNLPLPWYSFDHEGVHFIVLDTEPLVGKAGPTLEQQFAWLAGDLRDHAGQWTFVFVHRPVQPKLERKTGEPLSEELLQLSSGLLGRIGGAGAAGIINQATGRSPNILPANAERLAASLKSHGRIAGVFAGHLHRNYVGYWPEQTGNMPYVETASTKEYPCGYSITRVFTGGYMHNYYVPRDPRCLEWSAISQDAYARIGLQSKAGTLDERNFVVRFEELKLSSDHTRPSSQAVHP